MVAPAQHKFHALDAMRGVAAIAVALFHYRFVAPPPLRPFCFQSGYLAVDLFFVLSGFVIAFSYDAKLRAGMTFRRFIEARLIRLLPMVWLGVAIGALHLVLAGRHSTAGLIAVVALNGLMLPQFLAGSGAFATDKPIWSLFFEMIANAVYGLLRDRLSIHGLLLLIALGAIGLIGWSLGGDDLNGGASTRNFPLALARVTFSFLLGVLLCRTRSRWIACVPRVPPVLLLAVTLALLISPGIAKPFDDLVFIFFLSPMLVMAGAASPTGAGMTVAAVSLARLSYPLYVIHFPIRDLAIICSERLSVPVDIVAPSALAATVLMSLALARLYDDRVRRALSRWAEKRRQADDAAPLRPASDTDAVPQRLIG